METNNNINITLYLLCGIVVVGTSLYLLNKYSVFKKKDSTFSNICNKPKTLADLQKESAGSKSNIVTSMQDIVGYLSGNLNALYNLSKNELDGLESNLFDGISLTVEAHGNEVLKEWFKEFVEKKASWTAAEYKQKAKCLLDMFEKCGIKAVTEQEIVWSYSQSLKYKCITQVTDGTVCEVLLPYWTLQGNVFERGIVKIKG